MIREALVNDAPLFVGWKTRGVLRTRPVARRCHHLFDKGSAHEPRENRFQQRPPASGPGFRVDRQRDRIRRELAPSSVVPKVRALAPVPLRTSGEAPSPRPSSRRRRSPSAGRQVIQRRTDGVVKLSKRRREADCCASNGRSDLAPRGHSRGAKHAVVWADMRWRWTLKML